MDRLAELKTLVAIVDCGSLSAAGRILRRSLPAVSRDLASLEHRIGTRLVERSTKCCRATPAGARLADHARQLLANYDDAVGEAAGERTTASGEVRLTAPTGFGRDHVAPLIFDFLGRYPAIRIELYLADRMVHLVDEEYDLAVRIGHLPDSALLSRKVGEVRSVVVASPAYLQARGTPQSPADLGSHEMIQHTGLGAGSSSGLRALGRRGADIAIDCRLAVNQAETAIAAARDGLGLVHVLSHQVAADLKSGMLVRVLQPWEPDAVPVSLVWPESRRRWRRIRLLVDHLADELAALEVLQ